MNMNSVFTNGKMTMSLLKTGTLQMKFVLSLALAGLAAIGTSTATAAPLFFTDKASFDIATNTSLVEDFEATGQPSNVSIVPGFANNGIVYTGLASPNVFIADGFANFGLIGPIPSRVLTASGLEDFTVDFGSPSTAVGFDTYLNLATVLDNTLPDTVRVFGSSGLLGSFNPIHDPTTIGFLGILATEPITSIRWTTVGGDSINTGIDNIVQGSAVPEPASHLLIALLTVSCILCNRSRDSGVEEQSVGCHP